MCLCVHGPWGLTVIPVLCTCQAMNSNQMSDPAFAIDSNGALTRGDLEAAVGYKPISSMWDDEAKLRRLFIGPKEVVMAPAGDVDFGTWFEREIALCREAVAELMDYSI